MFETIGKILSSFVPRTISQEDKMAAISRIESIISKAGTISVFSKSYCPYCLRAKSILSSYGGVQPRLQIFELDKMGKEGQILQSALAEKLGKSNVTVPQIFIGQKHVGGCDDLTGLRSNGTLDDLIENVKKVDFEKPASA